MNGFGSGLIQPLSLFPHLLDSRSPENTPGREFWLSDTQRGFCNCSCLSVACATT